MTGDRSPGLPSNVQIAEDIESEDEVSGLDPNFCAALCSLRQKVRRKRDDTDGIPQRLLKSGLLPKYQQETIIAPDPALALLETLGFRGSPRTDKLNLEDVATATAFFNDMSSSDSLGPRVGSAPPRKVMEGPTMPRHQRHTPRTPCAILPSRFHMGYLRSEVHMVDMKTFDKDEKNEISEIELVNSQFCILFRFSATNGELQLYRILAPLSIASRVFEVIDSQHGSVSALIIALSNPPEVSVGRLQNHQKITRASFQRGSLREGVEVWDRAANIPPQSMRYGDRPVALHEQYQVDFGRWTVFRIELPEEERQNWARMKEMLHDEGIKVNTIADNVFQTTRGGTPNAAEDHHLPFEARYMLEACLSHGVLHEDNITIDFLRELQRHSKGSAGRQSRSSIMLAFIALKSRRWWQPQDIFSDGEILRYHPSQKMPEYCCLVRKAVITPTTVHFSPPSVETSHRLLRAYKQYQDRFLRVQFLDEKHKGGIHGRIWDDGGSNNQEEMWNRVRRTLQNGIRIGGRHYRFLAYGNSQLRESGALFFCDDHTVTCESIRKAMGSFDHIRNPAKYAARMGQCLSTTRAPSLSFSYNIVEIPDIKHVTLNRQTITILSFLGVADHVFMKMLAAQILGYEQSMVNSTIAERELASQTDINGVLPAMADMVANGFMDVREPFMMALLNVWRVWSLKQLKDKGRLIVKDGAFVFGTVDETDTLRGFHHGNSQLPQIFLQVPRGYGGQYQVVRGKCIVGRNPTLHPGDIRLVEAVDVDALHHLHDVVVFPARGDRDIPSMCSGGDLDGDEFFVIWDHAFVNIKQHEPMEHTTATAPEPNRDVTVDDVTDFFVKYMKNNCLGIIAHAHLATADYLNAGHSRCIELANLHSKSVDFNKTGTPAQMSKSLRPPAYPHFMEKKGRREYRSERVLGQIYDHIAIADFLPEYTHSFDRRILQAFDLPEKLMAQAEVLKYQYDAALRDIMTEQRIMTEFEFWSAFVLSKPPTGRSDYNRQEEIGLLRCGLIDQFTDAAYELIQSRTSEKLHPFVAACYAVTNRQVQARLHELDAEGQVAMSEDMPFISFPWLFERELGLIATKFEAAISRAHAATTVAASTEDASADVIALSAICDTAEVSFSTDKSVTAPIGDEEEEEEEVDNDTGGLALFDRLLG
ncbi:RNA dependent RNA polymerase-domain-containing protein [Microdochium bolleyi]|uniref:RNA-dependent RNA polymerase n=1 Tax=Microdochium bolleyi TaxID=196109 RepID=A0A136J9B9_9PEZI|nr:RNA dependent RNA polymerase-domain-containing protein [Microdochium bolleyi]